MRLRDFHAKYNYLMNDVMPSLHNIIYGKDKDESKVMGKRKKKNSPWKEQLVLMQLFHLTVGQDKQTCSISYGKLGQILDMSWKSVARALENLERVNIIKTRFSFNKQTPNIAKSYEIVIPDIAPDQAALPYDIEFEPSEAYDTLTDEGKRQFRLIKRSLSEEEIAEYKAVAKSELKKGEDLNKKVDLLILNDRFGKGWMDRYAR